MADQLTHTQKLQQSFSTQLFLGARLLDELAQAQVNLEAGKRVARPALMRLLPHLGFEGIRPTELAKKVDVSKQAIGVAVAELRAQGLVELVPDPLDGRARLVRLTRKGAGAFELGLSVLGFYEEQLRARLGPKKMLALRQGIDALVDVLSGWERSGGPRRQQRR